ncbi:MAG: PopZ family protein [Xanthobacteraceae bacterium]
MTQPARSNEPSMEEILASIRRIIADDDAGKPTQQPAEPPKPAAAAVKESAPMPAPAPAPADFPSLIEDVEESDGLNGHAVDEEQATDILDLTESMTTAMPPPMPPSRAPAAAVPQFRTIDGDSDVSFDEAPERPAPQASINANMNPQPQLLSSATSAAVDSAFNALAQTVLVQNARTLEDLVREMLRPMLKNWLDENLPGLVERLVRSEIERVSRGR